MQVSFLNPSFLFLLLLIPVLWWIPAATGKTLQKTLRSLIFAAIVLALAKPVWFSASVRNYQVFICDRSGSLDQNQLDKSEAELERLLENVPDEDQPVVISFGQSDWKPKSKRSYAFHFIKNESTSSLAAALETASQQIPKNGWGSVTVLSDGLSTDRRWGPAIQTLLERKIPINTLDLGLSAAALYPTSVEVPESVRVGQTVTANVKVVGQSDGFKVRVSTENRILAESSSLKSNGQLTAPLQFEAKKTGTLKLEVSVIPDSSEANPSNNQLTKLIAIQPPIKALYIGDRVVDGAGRFGSLVGSGIEVEDGSKRTLDKTVDLKGYDVVVLDDVPAKRLSEGFQQNLHDAISNDGLGLLYAGGEASFGTGGYDKTTIAKTLPIEFKQNNEKKDPSTALAIIVDSSGSMAGTRIDLAKQIARLAVRKLQAHDRVGIVEFYGAKHWAIPMQPAANKIEIDRAIGRIQATGGTILMPAIEEAYYGLKNVETRYKHILVLTDAGVENGDYQTLLRRISKDGINVSTVLVGPGVHNVIMNDMANWGKGRFYSVSDRMSLIELILKQPIDNKLPSYKKGSFALDSRSGKGWWSNVDRTLIPEINGYVETRLKPQSEVLLEVAQSKHPVLASWRYGLGRVTTLMTEPVGPGTAGWKNWKDYGRFLARSISRTASDKEDFGYTLDRQDNTLTIWARRFQNDPNATPSLSRQDLVTKNNQEVTFQQMTPEIFQAKILIDPAQPVSLTGPNGLHLVSNVSDDYRPENQTDPELGIDLEKLSTVSGGVSLTGDQTPVMKPDSTLAKTDVTLTKLWFWLIAFALGMYLVEITYRRWPKMA